MSPLASRTVLALASLAVLAACDDSTPPTSPSATDAASVRAEASVQTQVGELRSALARYHRLDYATANGYPVAITPCWYHGDLGAMGYHYADPVRIDGTVEALQPEALVYEPLPGGNYRLVAAEYIVPITAWQGDTPPALFGRAFDRNEALGIYALHVWAWVANPAGIFAPWNAKVTCDYAAESEDRM